MVDAISKPADVDVIMRALADRLSEKKMRAGDLFRKIQIDHSNDGTLDGAELRAGLVDLGFKTTDPEFAAIMSRIDKEGTGDVSLREFEKALKAADKLHPVRRKTVEEPVVAKKKQGISAEDMEEFRQIFCLFKQLCRKKVGDDGKEQILVDWNETGGISVSELEQLLESVGCRLDCKELQTMLGELDMDGDGEIDFQEFCHKMAQEVQVDHAPDDIAKSFKAFSRGAPTGLIRVEDLRNALTTYMHKEMTDSDVEALLLHFRDCFVKLPGSTQEYFNYQDYIDLMAPMVERPSADG